MNSPVKTAVIGHPVGHSLSPLIHNHWIATYGLTGTYEAIDIPPDDLAAGVKKLIAEGYAGFNVTIPHKQAIMALCEDIDPTARAIGAVNTVAIKAGKLTGYNTDAYGFIENIRQQKPGFDFTAGPALILGAGGAARAVAYGLKQASVPEIFITNRTAEKSQKLAKELGLSALEWEKRNDALSNKNLLVNTTALGMNGQPPLKIDLSALPTTALVCDIVYKPLMTDLLTAATTRGHPVVKGLGMLLHQARPAFEYWFKTLPDVTPDLEQKLQEAAQ